MRIYISGGISGVPDYKSIFAKAEYDLSQKGYEVVNPAKVDIPCLSYDEYMKVDLTLLSMCDAIYMLKGWKDSKGACMEYGYAFGTDKIIINEV